MVKLIGKCKKIVGKPTRHPKYIFTFEVILVAEGKYQDAEVTFELYMDFGGMTLLRLLNAKWSRERGEYEFDGSKEIELTFERRLAGRPPPSQLRLKKFRERE